MTTRVTANVTTDWTRGLQFHEVQRSESIIRRCSAEAGNTVALTRDHCNEARAFEKDGALNNTIKTQDTTGGNTDDQASMESCRYCHTWAICHVIKSRRWENKPELFKGPIIPAYAAKPGRQLPISRATGRLEGKGKQGDPHKFSPGPEEDGKKNLEGKFARRIQVNVTENELPVVGCFDCPQHSNQAPG